MKELLELMPEFNLIKNTDLKNKVLKVWEEGIKEGGWEIKELTEMPYTLLIEDTDISFIDHNRGVVNCCIGMAKAMKNVYADKIKIDMDILLAGALLHDVGKMIEISKEGNKFVKSYKGKLLRHPFSGANMAYKWGLPEEVVHIIAVHSKEGDHSKRTPEAVILHHSDFTNFEAT
ncbi:HDIG domain-containing metalloprotein [candidate division KSB1 bacterium]